MGDIFYVMICEEGRRKGGLVLNKKKQIWKRFHSFLLDSCLKEERGGDGERSI